MAILIVEDDLGLQALLKELLTEQGYEVETASEGRAALARIQRGDLDLVLLDRLLPGMEGTEICRYARGLNLGAYLPVILLTGLGGEGNEHAGFEAGADDYVCKPFHPQVLLDRVAVWIRTRKRLKVAHERLLADQ